MVYCGTILFLGRHTGKNMSPYTQIYSRPWRFSSMVLYRECVFCCDWWGLLCVVALQVYNLLSFVQVLTSSWSTLDETFSVTRNLNHQTYLRTHHKVGVDITSYILTKCTAMYEDVSKRFRTESITKYLLTFDIAHLEETQRVMVAKRTILTHKITIQLHLVAESCIICSSRSRWSVRKLLDTPSYVWLFCS
jgi:hypothetical protein